MNPKKIIIDVKHLCIQQIEVPKDIPNSNVIWNLNYQMLDCNTKQTLYFDDFIF